MASVFYGEKQAVSPKAEALLREFVDAAFACGEWQEGDTESYVPLYRRKRNAEEALRKYIAGLQGSKATPSA